MSEEFIANVISVIKLLDPVVDYFEKATLGDFISWGLSTLGILTFLLKNKILVFTRKTISNKALLPVFNDLKDIKTMLRVGSSTRPDLPQHITEGLTITIEIVEKYINIVINKVSKGHYLDNLDALKDDAKLFYADLEKALNSSCANTTTRKIILEKLAVMSKPAKISVKGMLNAKYYKNDVHKLDILLGLAILFIRDVINTVIRDA